MTDHLAAWRALTDDPDPHAAVTRHLAFLTGTDACRALLARLMGQFRRVEVDGDRLLLVFAYAEFDEECEVQCDAPYTGPAGDAPPSMVEIARVHNGMTWAYLGGGGMGFQGLNDGAVCEGGWEADALTDAALENAPFLARVADAGLTIQDVTSPADYGQNWLIWDPVERNTLGEPMLYFVSHADCEAVRVDSAMDLAFGPLVLRIMVQDIVGEDVLPEVYS